MNNLQLLKIYGQLPDIMAKNLPSITVTHLQQHILDTRSCGTPDAADLEIASTVTSAEIDTLANLLSVDHDECIGIIEMHRRMLSSDSGDYNNNRWGKCVSAFPNNYALTYYLNLDTFPDHYKRPTTREELEKIIEAGTFRWTIEQLLDECLGKPMVEVAYDYFILETYRVLGCQHVRVLEKSKANINIYATNLGGNIIGRAWFTSGNCSDQVDHQIDKNYQPGLVGMCKLGTHEGGHNHGEGHTFSGQNTHHGVMSYDPPKLFYGYSTGKSPHVLPKDPAIQSLIDKYGGVPVPLVGGPVTPVPPTNIDLPKKLTRPNGVIVLNEKLHKFWIEEA